VQPLRARTEGSGALKIHDKSRWIPLIDVLKGEMNGLRSRSSSHALIRGLGERCRSTNDRT